ncbi:enoyl-CoA hydratase/carnithine racemase [Bradyrhizobium sp. i1.4.4]
MSDTADAASGPVLERDGARATIRLNRPKHLNRLQAEDLGELVRLFSTGSRPILISACWC